MVALGHPAVHLILRECIVTVQLHRREPHGVHEGEIWLVQLPHRRCLEINGAFVEVVNHDLVPRIVLLRISLIYRIVF